MTIYVLEDELTVNVAFNVANLQPDLYNFLLTSQYSHKGTGFSSSDTTLLYSNSRYSMFEITFPVGFGDAHKNGIYYWKLYGNSYPDPSPIQQGLVKIITNPGGEIHTLAYNSGTVTEERVSEVFYRPNYT